MDDTVDTREAFRSLRARTNQDNAAADTTDVGTNPEQHDSDFIDLENADTNFIVTDPDPHHTDALSAEQVSAAAKLHTEKWRLVGPGVRELPSPAYLAMLEQQQPGTIGQFLDCIDEDIHFTREAHKEKAERTNSLTSVRVFVFLGYAGLSLLCALLLYILGRNTAGTIMAVLSGVALLLSSDLTALIKPFRSSTNLRKKPTRKGPQKPPSVQDTQR